MTVLYKTPGGFTYLERNDGLYEAQMAKDYWSERYKKLVKIKIYQVRDGATGVRDIVSFAWWAHDQLCDDGVWADGSDVTPWQAACVLGDILRSEGRWFRATTWKYATLFLGCKRSRGVITDETTH